MLRLGCLCCILTVLTAGAATAGAWPRAQGTGFVSGAHRLSWPQDIATWQSNAPTGEYTSLYVEYGMTARLTLGLDLGLSVSGAEKAVGFVQIPLRNRETGAKVSAQLGFGKIEGEPVLRPGVMLGWGHRKGWMSVDLIAEMGLDSGDTDVKMDLTVGYRLPKARKLVVQLQTGDTAAFDPFARLETSVVFPVTQRFKAETGVIWGFHNDTSMGLKFGFWTEF